MIKIEIKGFNKAADLLGAMHKQVRYATAVALSRTARAIADEQSKLLKSELDRPKQSTVRAIRYTRATKDNLTAKVRFKNRGEGVPAAEFIGHNISGGRRPLKRSEIMLRAAGILPSGLVTIPGSAAKLDAYGNMARGQIVSILSYFRTFGAARSGKGDLLNSPRMNRSATRARSPSIYFVVPPGAKMPAGIWQRTKSQAKPVLMFVPPGSHRKLVKFHATAQRIVGRDFNRFFNEAFAAAIRTAR